MAQALFRSHWLCLAVLLAPAALARPLVRVVPPANLLRAGASHAFQAEVTGAVEPAVTWSVQAGRGAVDAATGVFTPGDQGAREIREVTLRATLAMEPGTFDQATVQVLGAPLYDELASDERGILAALDRHEPDWLKVWVKGLPFEDPQLRLLPRGCTPADDQHKGLGFFPLDADGKEPLLSLYASYGLPVRINLGTQSATHAMAFRGAPGGLWKSQNVTGQKTLTLVPDEHTRTIGLQTLTARPGKPWLTSRMALPVELFGVLPLAGRPEVRGAGVGTGTAARFDQLSGMAWWSLPDFSRGSERGQMVVSDTGSHTLRLVSGAGRVLAMTGAPGVAGYLDGLWDQARFRGPTFLESAASDGKPGRTLYVADTGNHAVRFIEGIRVHTLTGVGGQAGYRESAAGDPLFNQPRGLALDPGTRSLYVADSGNQVIRSIQLDTRAVSLLAGSPGTPGTTDGSLLAARFHDLKGLIWLKYKQALLVVDGHSLREINLATGMVSTICGIPDQPLAADAELPGQLFAPLAVPCLRNPWGIADSLAGIFIADEGNRAIRLLQSEELNAPPGRLLTVAGDGTLPFTRYGLLRSEGLMAAGPLKNHYAAFAAPRALLMGSHVDSFARFLNLTVADGSALSRLTGLIVPLPLAAPRLLPPSGPIIAGKAHRLSFWLGKADGDRTPFCDTWSLEFLREDGSACLPPLLGADLPRNQVDRSVTFPEPGPVTLRLSSLTRDGSTLMARLRVAVQAPGAEPPGPREAPKGEARKVPAPLPPAPAPAMPGAGSRPAAHAETKEPDHRPFVHFRSRVPEPGRAKSAITRLRNEKGIILRGLGSHFEEHFAGTGRDEASIFHSQYSNDAAFAELLLEGLDQPERKEARELRGGTPHRLITIPKEGVGTVRKEGSLPRRANAYLVTLARDREEPNYQVVVTAYPVDR